MKGILDKIAHTVTVKVKQVLAAPEYDFSGVELSIVYDESTSNDLNIRTKFNGRLSIDEQDLLQRVIEDIVLRTSSEYVDHPKYNPVVYKNGWMVFSTESKEEPIMDTELHSPHVVRTIIKQYYKNSTPESIVNTIRAVFTHYTECILPSTTRPSGDIVEYNFDFRLASDNVTFYGCFNKCITTNKDKQTIKLTTDIETSTILDTLSNTIIQETLLFKYSINPISLHLTTNRSVKILDLVNASLEYLYPSTFDLIHEIYSDSDRNVIIVLYKTGSYLDIVMDAVDMSLNEISNRVLDAIVNNG